MRWQIVGSREKTKVVLAQSVERLLPIPDVRGSNPAIGKILVWTFSVICNENNKIKKKEAGNGPFLKKRRWWNYMSFFSFFTVTVNFRRHTRPASRVSTCFVAIIWNYKLRISRDRKLLLLLLLLLQSLTRFNCNSSPGGGGGSFNW